MQKNLSNSTLPITPSDNQPKIKKDNQEIQEKKSKIKKPKKKKKSKNKSLKPTYFSKTQRDEDDSIESNEKAKENIRALPSKKSCEEILNLEEISKGSDLCKGSETLKAFNKNDDEEKQIQPTDIQNKSQKPKKHDVSSKSQFINMAKETKKKKKSQMSLKKKLIETINLEEISCEKPVSPSKPDEGDPHNLQKEIENPENFEITDQPNSAKILKNRNRVSNKEYLPPQKISKKKESKQLIPDSFQFPVQAVKSNDEENFSPVNICELYNEDAEPPLQSKKVNSLAISPSPDIFSSPKQNENNPSFILFEEVKVPLKKSRNTEKSKPSEPSLFSKPENSPLFSLVYPTQKKETRRKNKNEIKKESFFLQ